MVELPGRQPEDQETGSEKEGPAKPKKSPLTKIAVFAAIAAVAFAAVALTVSRNSSTGAVGEGVSGQDMAVQEETQPEAPVPTVMIAGEELPGKPGRTGFIRKGPVRQRLGKPGADDGIKKSEPGRKPGYFRPDGPGRIDRFGGTETAKPFPDQWPCALSGLTGLTTFSAAERTGSQQPVSMIQDYSPLAGMTGLKELSLVATNLSDFLSWKE